MAIAFLATVQVFKFDVVQVLHNDEWLDYATIKDRDDVQGLNWLRCDKRTFRLQRYSDRSTVEVEMDRVFAFAGER